MALDTKYRPLRYEDVIGQEQSVSILRQFLVSGAGFHQSYVFSGAHGSGKTTLGRILARALLCEHPVGGDPCDACHSCRAILDTGSSECFFEVDAATNSGKEDINRIKSELEYSTFAGKQRIYLFDEAHRLSKDALDGLLKVMEDSLPGSDNKRLVCIFCTTEPEKMKATIFSRCAPAFTIRPVSPEKIGERLAMVCDKEGLQYEREALTLIAEVVECHIRDALKAVEGVSMLGAVTTENVRAYLRLDSTSACLNVLVHLGKDLPALLMEGEKLMEFVSPATCYERLVEAASMSYKVSLGVGKPPTFWNAEVVAAIGQQHGDFLLTVAGHLASRPARSTGPMLLCDLAHLHRVRAGGQVVLPVQTMQQVVQAAHAAHGVQAPPVVSEQRIPTPVPETKTVGKVEISTPRLTGDGTWLDPRASNRRDKQETTPKHANRLPAIAANEFRTLLQRRVAELSEDERSSRSARWTNMGGH